MELFGAEEEHLGPPPPGEDQALDAIEAWWRSQDRVRERLAEGIRRSMDEVLDGQRTGRFRIEQLTGVERSYLETKVQIVLRDAFDVPQGPSPKKLAFSLDAHATGCCFSLDSNRWSAPKASVGDVSALICASDADAVFSFGLLRCRTEDVATRSRDGRRRVNEHGLARIRWLWHDESMPDNLLRTLPKPTLQAIFAQPGAHNGQARINELLRRVQKRVLRRTVTETVAQQRDSMKRLRDARKLLQDEGIIVLGHQNDHPRIARDLELPVPRKGDVVAVRLVNATPQRQMDHRPSAVIGGRTWIEALPGDPIERGPDLPY